MQVPNTLVGHNLVNNKLKKSAFNTLNDQVLKKLSEWFHHWSLTCKLEIKTQDQTTSLIDPTEEQDHSTINRENRQYAFNEDEDEDEVVG